MFQAKVVEKIKKFFMFINFFFSFENCTICENNVEIYGRTGQATDDNIIRLMRIACWITKATHTLVICNTYCFSTVTIVTRTLHNVIGALPVLFSHRFVSTINKHHSCRGMQISRKVLEMCTSSLCTFPF